MKPETRIILKATLFRNGKYANLRLWRLKNGKYQLRLQKPTGEIKASGLMDDFQGRELFSLNLNVFRREEWQIITDAP